jgi:hypothetical protein
MQSPWSGVVSLAPLSPYVDDLAAQMQSPRASVVSLACRPAVEVASVGVVAGDAARRRYQPRQLG